MSDRPKIPASEPPPMRTKMFWVGTGVTVLWLGAGVYLMACKSSGNELPRPNEWGDIFAGLFAPVAFLWLVLGFLQQGRELQLQVTELKNSVEQQKELVGTAQAQLMAMSREQARQQQAEHVAAQPRLIFRAGGSSSSSNGTRYEVTMTNEGATATELKFRYTPLPRSAPLDYLAAISTHQEVAMPIVVDPSGFPPEGITVWIDFLDRRNMPGVLRYRWYPADLEKRYLKFDWLKEAEGNPLF